MYIGTHLTSVRLRCMYTDIATSCISIQMKKDGDSNLKGTKLGLEVFHEHIVGTSIQGNVIIAWYVHGMSTLNLRSSQGLFGHDCHGGSDDPPFID